MQRQCQRGSEDGRDVAALQLASHLAELAWIGDDHAYLLLVGKLDGIPDSALARRHNDQRFRAFQHRQHGLIFQIGLEALFLGGFGFLIAARVFEEFFQLAKLGLVILLRFSERFTRQEIRRRQKRPVQGGIMGKRMPMPADFLISISSQVQPSR